MGKFITLTLIFTATLYVVLNFFAIPAFPVIVQYVTIFRGGAQGLHCLGIGMLCAAIACLKD